MVVALLFGLVTAVGISEDAQKLELLQAIDLVRTKELDIALDELERLCPLPRKELSKARW